jgi:hypothetical protein
LEIGFIDHFNNTRRLVTTLFIAPSLISTLYKSLQRMLSLFQPVFTKHFLVMASNNGDSSASLLKSSLNVDSLPTELASKCASVINNSARTNINHSSSVVAEIVSAGMSVVCEDVTQ